jgi:hypothetical protein
VKSPGGDALGLKLNRGRETCSLNKSADIESAKAGAVGFNNAAFFSMATMLTPARVFWQQPCEAGIRICPHSFFMMWQQARSAALICASGAMQATTGERQMMFRSNSAPRLDKNFTLQDNPSRTGLPRFHAPDENESGTRGVSEITDKCPASCSQGLFDMLSNP